MLFKTSSSKTIFKNLKKTNPMKYNSAKMKIKEINVKLFANKNIYKMNYSNGK